LSGGRRRNAMLSDTFLSRAEVADLTGYQQRRKQTDWLRREGWPFAVGGDGHPRVLREELQRRLGASEGAKQPAPRLRFG
jgi:hypothetical protein